MRTPNELPASFDCLATAAVLRSGTVIALAGHVAVVTSVLLMVHGTAVAWIECCSALFWCAVVYLAVRVKMDSLFFELLALHPRGTVGSLAGCHRLA